MAAEVGGMPNGTYAPHHGYGGIDQNSYAFSANAQQVSQPPAQQAPPASSTPSNANAAPQAQAQQQPAQSEISKDEVGWYFVEQYYTTLSRSPEKLYLFYNKRSQFVSGTETDKVPVCVGQRAINDRIQELNFQDCKVRVTNVDSQSSDSNIVIQVIGELSNKGQPHKKFCQTFILATQTNGYFVLNDVFRYLADEEEEVEQETEPATEDVQQVSGTESGYQEPPPTEVEPKTLTSSTDPSAVEHDAKNVDKGIEEKLVKPQQAEEEAAPKVNGEHAAEPVEEKKEAPAAPTEPEPVPAKEEEERPSADEPAAEAALEPEKPKDPEPTPVASPPKQAPAQAAPAPKPAAPSVPMSWASRAAAANKVAVPTTPSSASSSTTTSRPTAAAKTATPPTAPAAASAQAQTPSAPTAPAAQSQQESPATDSQDEWSTVTSSHARQQSRQSNAPLQPEAPEFKGYIKNVSESVTKDELSAKLTSLVGELKYLDIARQKNCAFVDFHTRESYNKALGTSFKIGDDELQVEERRIRPGSTPYIPGQRGPYQGRGGRGGAGGPQRGQFQGRGGSAPGGPRGQFQGNRGNAVRGGRGGAGTQA